MRARRHWAWLILLVLAVAACNGGGGGGEPPSEGTEPTPGETEPIQPPAEPPSAPPIVIEPKQESATVYVPEWTVNSSPATNGGPANGRINYRMRGKAELVGVELGTDIVVEIEQAVLRMEDGTVIVVKRYKLGNTNQKNRLEWRLNGDRLKTNNGSASRDLPEEFFSAFKGTQAEKVELWMTIASSGETVRASRVQVIP